MGAVRALEPDKRIEKLLKDSYGYIHEISRITGRNVIVYYSGWLRFNLPDVFVNEKDKNAFMNAVYKMDRGKGLVLILHTPGGNIAATEGIVTYLKDLFNNNIHAIIPQISMSAGTMIAMACKQIVMGRQSSLGPTDPQFNNIACQMVVDEFKRAISEGSNNPAALELWKVIINKYTPTYITACSDAVKWSEELVTKWVEEANPGIDVEKVKKTFINHNKSYSHERRFSREECRNAGLPVIDLESNQYLQEAVLSLHHCLIILMDSMPILKMVINQLDRLFMLQKMQPSTEK